MQRYDIGATPLREGLSRLISRGLIVGIGQRGFRVADVSREDLEDITRMRTVVEIEALRLAIAQGDDAWEAGILSALHQMRRHIERTGDEFREGAPDFDRLHKGFHTSLLAACGSKRLLDGAFRSLRSGLSLSPGDDARLRQRRTVYRSRIRISPIGFWRAISMARTAMLASHLHSTLDYVYPPAKGDRS